MVTLAPVCASATVELIVSNRRACESEVSVRRQAKIPTPLLSQLPDDLKGLAKTALLQKMGYVTEGPYPSKIVGTWAVEAFDQLQLSGLISEAELVSVSEEMVRNSLKFIRDKVGSAQEWLSQRRRGERSLLPDGMPLKRQSFEAKYELHSFDHIRNAQTKNYDSGLSIGLDRVFKVAANINNAGLASEAIRYMLILSDYMKAISAAETLQDSAALINIGLLGLSNYFLPESKMYQSSNAIYYSIEALKRVRGELRQTSNRILFDLAARLAAEDSLEYAIRSLRSTGEVVAIWKSNNHTIYINKIEDKEVRTEMRRLIELALKNKIQFGAFTHELDLAKAAAYTNSPFTKDVLIELEEEKSRLAKNQKYLLAHGLPERIEGFETTVDQLYRENCIRHFARGRVVYRAQEIAYAKSRVAQGDGLNAIDNIIRAAMQTPPLPEFRIRIEAD